MDEIQKLAMMPQKTTNFGINFGLDKILPFMSSRSHDGLSSMAFRTQLPKEPHDTINRSLVALDNEAQISIFHPSDRLG